MKSFAMFVLCVFIVCSTACCCIVSLLMNLKYGRHTGTSLSSKKRGHIILKITEQLVLFENFTVSIGSI